VIKLKKLEPSKNFIRYASYRVISEHKDKTGDYPSGLYFNKIMFLLYRHLKQKSLDIKLPHYWYRYGDQVYQYNMPSNLFWDHENPSKTVVKWNYGPPAEKGWAYELIDDAVSELTNKYIGDEFSAVREVYKYAPFKFQVKFLDLREAFHGRKNAFNWNNEAYNTVSKHIFLDTIKSFPKSKFPELTHQYEVVRTFSKIYLDGDWDFKLVENVYNSFWFLFCYYLRLHRKAHENIPKSAISVWESKIELEKLRYRRAISDLIIAASEDRPQILRNDLIKGEYDWRKEDLEETDKMIDEFIGTLEEFKRQFSSNHSNQ